MAAPLAVLSNTRQTSSADGRLRRVSGHAIRTTALWDTGNMAGSGSLFEHDLPAGFYYRDNFITSADERALLDEIAAVAFTDFEMRGVVARRRVAFFGQSYDRAPAGPIPLFLLPLRDALAVWAGVDADAFAMALINEYRPGSPIGWHRDAPQYDIVAGVSLLSPCRMKFRPYPASPPTVRQSGRRSATHEIVLERRSAYLMTQESRSLYEHHIPPVAELRYSVTFRTLR
jgi:alkylated DNA repair dioxygenase AlkB